MASPQEVAETLGLIRRQGGRVTTPRRALLEALLDSAGRHVTADHLATAVQAAHPEIARSTVYRTLVALEGLGVVTHVHLGHGPAVYHLTGDRHAHLVCESCGVVITVPEGFFDDQARRIKDEFDFSTGSPHFAVTGRCTHCS